MASPLLETSINGARKAIVSVTCGGSVSLFEAQEAVSDATGEDLDIKFGVSINSQLDDQILVSIIATDFAEEYDFTAIPQFGTRPTLVKEEKKEESNASQVENNDDERHSSVLSSFLKRND